MLVNLATIFLPLRDEYYNKYKEYFDFLSLNNTYVYKIRIININDNDKWPLEHCPECSFSFKESEPRKTSISIMRVTSRNKYLIGLFLLVCMISIFAFIYPFLILFVIFTLVIGILYMPPAKDFVEFDFYNCVKCNSLVYNNFPPELTTPDSPNTVFHKLEQIPGFKLK